MTSHRTNELTRRGLIKSTAAVAVAGMTMSTALAQTPEGTPTVCKGFGYWATEIAL